MSLCIKTWKRFLPEYKIILLDFQKAKYYLGEQMFNNIIDSNLSIMVQTDAIRVAMLKKFGGIWMDADTIVTNGNFIKSLKNNDLVMIINKKTFFAFIAFIFASKNSIILKEWLKIIISKVKYSKDIHLNQNNKSIAWLNSLGEVNSWYYLGNGIIDNLIINKTKKDFLGIDYQKILVFPEDKYIRNSSFIDIQRYNLFFYKKGNPQKVLDISKDLVFLHNSWTPLKYKQMSEKEFLHQDILLSKLFAKLLN